MQLPAAWYPLVPSARLRRGQVVQALLAGVGLAVFRGHDGLPRCVQARCGHLGADLARGQVIGNRLRCGLHHRCFAGDGSAEDAGQPGFEVIERWGLVFVRIGSDGPSLPRPDGVPDALHSRVDAVAVDAPLELIVANAFDVDHLAPVHGRTVVGAAVLHQPQPGAIAIAFTARIAGQGLRDRLLRSVGQGEIAIETWCWGGSLLLFHHRRFAACTVLALRPLDDQRCQAYAVTVRAAPARLPARLAASIALAVQHRVIAAFARQDVAALAGSRRGGIRLDPARDAVLGRFLEHQATLPMVAWGQS